MILTIFLFACSCNKPQNSLNSQNNSDSLNEIYSFGQQTGFLLTCDQKLDEEMIRRIEECSNEVIYEDYSKIIGNILISDSENQNLPLAVYFTFTPHYEELAVNFVTHEGKYTYRDCITQFLLSTNNDTIFDCFTLENDTFDETYFVVVSGTSGSKNDEFSKDIFEIISGQRSLLVKRVIFTHDQYKQIQKLRNKEDFIRESKMFKEVLQKR